MGSLLNVKIPVTWKEKKESFVSGLGGTTLSEIFILICLIELFCSLHRVTLHRYPKLSFLTSWGLDYLFIIFPTILSMTVLSDHLLSVMAILLATISALYFTPEVKQEIKTRLNSLPKETIENLLSSKKSFLTNYRATTMMLTCVAILAVDFKIFPRRFAKTETFGSGLMDIGVGSFVVANGVVYGQTNRNLLSFRRSLIKTWPLIALGMSRILSTTLLGYQQHLGEYGVHWNFFFTLFVVVMMTTATEKMMTSSSLWLLSGIFLSVAYQLALSVGGLSDYLMDERRSPNLLSLNKEGIFSSIGFWALNILSVEMGRQISSRFSFRALSDKKKEDVEITKKVHGQFQSMLIANFCLWLIVVAADSLVQKISRKTCNLSYILWALAQNLTVILLALARDIFLPTSEIQVYQAMSSFMMFTFLAANLMTGVVNLSIDTLEVSSVIALVVLSCYMAVLTAVVSALRFFNLKL